MSEEFINSIASGEESELMECEVCHRMHYVIGADKRDDDEIFSDKHLEKMWKRILVGAKVHPDKFIGWDRPIPYGYFTGNEIVVGCPCNEEYIKPFESMIWRNRNIILDYFIKRVQNIMMDKTVDVFNSAFDNMMGADDLAYVKKLVSKIQDDKDSHGYKRVVKRSKRR
jgi:hypothetical protein